MAPHKDVATLLRAFDLLRKEHGVLARLVLAGPWSHRGYRRAMEALAAQMSVAGSVEVRGEVSRAELHELYAESRVFALTSRCESFGLPAVEAQAFGTPVVASACTAVPEVCGRGAELTPPGDASATASALARLLTDDAYWARMSDLASENARRFRWERTSPALLAALDAAAACA
jgi:glycosyltransferase involved in cell wall biosynthesis